MIRESIAALLLTATAGAAGAQEVPASYFGSRATTTGFGSGGGYASAPAFTFDGNRYTSSTGDVAVSDFLACRSGSCIGTTQSGRAIDVLLGSPTGAAGAYVSGFSDAWSITGNFFGAGDMLLGSVTRTGSGFTPLFLGFAQPTDTIARVSFVDGSDDLRIIAVDDFVTQQAAIIPTGVPEPASWAMLLAGFFGIGGALRRRAAHRPAHA